MSTPLVSICLPNLNTRPFLQERMDTILAQTLTDWELIISDNYSDDGSWEFFQQYEQHPRIKMSQAPRAGMYANWNECIRRATGKYIYIATSDDTMAPDCLEKMVMALESHSDCDLCHTTLRVLNEDGVIEPGWWLRTRVGQFFGDTIDKPHVRMAPLDGLLHCCLQSVYISITQLLIRRSLFDAIGMFPTHWGSEGDFVWCMRVSLQRNTVHTPNTWAGWRIHASQSTLVSDPMRPYRLAKMVADALPRLGPINSQLYRQVCQTTLPTFYQREFFRNEYRHLRTRYSRLQLLAQLALTNPLLAVDFVMKRHRDTKLDPVTTMKDALSILGLNHNLRMDSVPTLAGD